MPINLADLQTGVVVLAAPIVAGGVAADAGAGWYVALFVIGGLAAGAVLGWLIHFVAYRILPAQTRHQWLEAVLYILGPPVIWCAGLMLVSEVSFILSRFLS